MRVGKVVNSNSNVWDCLFWDGIKKKEKLEDKQREMEREKEIC